MVGIGRLRQGRRPAAHRVDADLTGRPGADLSGEGDIPGPVPLISVQGHVCDELQGLDRRGHHPEPQDETARRLMKVPSVGGMTAHTFSHTADDPSRCRRGAKAATDLGLTPHHRQSGEPVTKGRVPRWRDRPLRSHLFEAARGLLQRARRWRALTAWGLSLAKRAGMKAATTRRRAASQRSPRLRRGDTRQAPHIRYLAARRVPPKCLNARASLPPRRPRARFRPCRAGSSNRQGNSPLRSRRR